MLFLSSIYYTTVMLFCQFFFQKKTLSAQKSTYENGFIFRDHKCSFALPQSILSSRSKDKENTAGKGKQDFADHVFRNRRLVDQPLTYCQNNDRDGEGKRRMNNDRNARCVGERHELPCHKENGINRNPLAIFMFFTQKKKSDAQNGKQYADNRIKGYKMPISDGRSVLCQDAVKYQGNTVCEKDDEAQKSVDPLLGRTNVLLLFSAFREIQDHDGKHKSKTDPSKRGCLIFRTVKNEPIQGRERYRSEIGKNDQNRHASVRRTDDADDRRNKGRQRKANRQKACQSIHLRKARKGACERKIQK